MKDKFLTAAIIILNYFVSYAQSNWEWINYYPTNNNLTTAVTVGNSAVFWGDMKTFIRTDDLGESFIYGTYSEIIDNNSFEGGFQKVFFRDSLNGILYDDGSYYTTNGGSYWIFPYSLYGSIGIYINNKVGIVLSTGRCEKTYDGGNTWNNFPSPDLKFLYNPERIFALDENKMWIASSYHEYGEGSILYSTNGGHYWTKIKIPGLDYNEKKQLSFYDIKFNKRGFGIAVGEIYYTMENRRAGLILKSSDFGLTWEWQEYENIALTYIVNTTDGDWFIYGNKNNVAILFSSEDSGMSWDINYYPFESEDLSTFYSTAYIPKLKAILVSTSRGFFRSTDNGKSYHKVNNGFNVRITDIKMDPHGSVNEQVSVAYSESLKYLLSKNGGRDWELKYFPDYIGYGSKSIEIIDRTIILRNRNESVLVSDDYGNTWRELWYLQNKSIRNLAVYNDQLFGVTIFINNLPKLLISNDGGTRWEIIPIDYRVNLSSIKFVNENLIIGTGVFNESGITRGTLFFCYNKGNLWRVVELSDIYKQIEFVSGSIGYILNDTNILRTTDTGNSWEGIYGNQPNKLMASYDFIDSTRILIQITDNSIYSPRSLYFTSSRDKGKTWNEVSLSLPLKGPLKKIKVNKLGDILTVGMNGELLRRKSYYDLSSSNSTVLLDSKETSFSLGQNYPNPFNPSTTIEYTIPTPLSVPPRHTELGEVRGRDMGGVVTLKVYDILGREIATLVNEFQQPGKYSVEFNVETFHGTSLPSGVYFYSLRITDSSLRLEFQETKKMLLIK
ncbi:MAG: hypothetical protein AB1521_17880 [Bacteroidota bacterium]